MRMGITVSAVFIMMLAAVPAMADPAAPTAAETSAMTAKLVGNWNAVMVFDDDKLKAMLKEHGTPDDKLADAVATMKKGMANLFITFTFRADGTGESVGPGPGGKPEKDAFKWSILEIKDGSPKIRMIDATDKPQDMTVTFTATGFDAVMSEDETGPLKSPVAFVKGAATTAPAP